MKVTGHPVDGFNTQVQTRHIHSGHGLAGPPSNASNEYLMLEFVPETMTSQQPGLRLPEAMHPDLVIIAIP